MRSKMSRGKLTDQEVRMCRNAKGWGALKDVCEKLNISASVASKVRSKKTYSLVPDVEPVACWINKSNASKSMHKTPIKKGKKRKGVK